MDIFVSLSPTKRSLATFQQLQNWPDLSIQKQGMLTSTFWGTGSIMLR